jgi:hypothetical protein
MTENEIYRYVLDATVGGLLERYPLVSDFFANLRIPISSPEENVSELARRFDESTAEEFGLNKKDLPMQLSRFILAFHGDRPKREPSRRS